MFHMTRATAPALSTGGPAAGLLLEDHRIEYLLYDLFGLRVEARDGLELELEGFIRPALILAKQQLVGTDAEGHRHVADDIKGGLRDAAFVSF